MHVLGVSSAEKADSGEDPQRTNQQQHWEAQVSSGSRVPKATARLQTGESWYPGDDAGFLETPAALPESLGLQLYCSSWRTLQMCAGGRQLPVSVSSADGVPQKTAEALPAHAARHREQHTSAASDQFTSRTEQQQRANSGALETLVEAVLCECELPWLTLLSQNMFFQIYLFHERTIDLYSYIWIWLYFCHWQIRLQAKFILLC